MNYFRVHFAQPSNRLTLERVSSHHHRHRHKASKVQDRIHYECITRLLIFLSLTSHSHFIPFFHSAQAKDLDELVSSYAQNPTSSRLMQIPQASFTRDHYKQPILTEKHGVPFFYRLEAEDELTNEARKKLSGSDRQDMWIGNKKLPRSRSHEQNEENIIV